MLDYKLLEALARVAEEGGFDKAARRLHITQSAVSQRVRLLEDQTGMVLLTRTLPPVPTRAGRDLILHYTQVRQLEDDLTGRIMPDRGRGFRTLAMGINADSLATWFYPAVDSFFDRHQVLLDLRVDDQEQTHKLLKNGEVMGCISSEANPVQGCRTTFLGTMNYRLAAAPEFRDAYFPGGVERGALGRAPAVIFNRRDDLHARYLRQRFKADCIREVPAHFVPSSERFVDVILAGRAYGMVPDLQGKSHLSCGRLVELDPGNPVGVPLYWHRWNLDSRLLDEFSKTIVKNAVIC